MKDKPKWYRFPLEFKTEEDRTVFKNYVHSVKTSTGAPIYQTVNEMVVLHKRREKK